MRHRDWPDVGHLPPPTPATTKAVLVHMDGTVEQVTIPFKRGIPATSVVTVGKRPSSATVTTPQMFVPLHHFSLDTVVIDEPVTGPPTYLIIYKEQ